MQANKNQASRGPIGLTATCGAKNERKKFSTLFPLIVDIFFSNYFRAIFRVLHEAAPATFTI